MKYINLIRKIMLTAFLFATVQVVYAQTDTLTYGNGEFTVGEIKKMEQGIISIETAYSDSDFMIEWDKVNSIRSRQFYLITLSDGRRINGTLNSVGNNVVIDDGNTTTVSLIDVVEIRPVNDSFWDKVNANIDLGYNITKANNLKQFNTRAYVAYTTKIWEASGAFNRVFSNQDSVAATMRTDANLAFTLFLPRDWFLTISNEFLSNDEILLDLRSTSKVGAGNFIVHTNSMYFAIFGGAAFNNEVFTDTTSTRQSGEAYAGFEVNMFNTGDLSLLTNLTTYPSLTEDGRIRADFKFDIKYDLPKDFYIKLGTTVNYDNRPAGDADDMDYVFQTGLGWEW